MCWCRLLTAHPASRYTSARFVHNKPSARPVSQFQTELFNKLAAASVYFNLTHYPKEATSVFLGWIGSMFGSEVFGRSTGMCLQGDLLRVIHNTLRPRADQLSHRWWLDVHFFQKKRFSPEKTLTDIWLLDTGKFSHKIITSSFFAWNIFLLFALDASFFLCTRICINDEQILVWNKLVSKKFVYWSQDIEILPLNN